MFDVDGIVMYVKGSVIDFNRWKRDRLNRKIDKLIDKRDRKNAHIDSLIGHWLDSWSDVLNREGCRMPDDSEIDLRKMVLESE